jgi:adenosine deaminase
MVNIDDIPIQYLPTLIKAMPKAELHIHIEGSLEPELIFQLARRNGIALPYSNVGDLRAAYAFSDLQSFLDVYYACASVLQQEQDFYDMAWSYLTRAAAEHVVHAEIFFDPQTHTQRGVAMGAIVFGLSRACQDAHERLGVDAQLILCFLRHLSEESAMETLEQALPFREHFIGVGLDSSELGNPPEKFAKVFARCKAFGLHRVAHAGEEGPSSYVSKALDILEVERIDHGVNAIHDPDLMKRLVRERIPITVCPLSNVKLRVFPSLDAHNLVQMLNMGVCVTLNSDDPAYFGGYINDNYLQTVETLKLSSRQVFVLARNSFEASFVSAKQREIWLKDLEYCFENFRPETESKS